MYKLFDKVNGVYTLPNGSTKTSSELSQDSQYALLFSKNCVINVFDGVFTSYETLAQFASKHGIEYDESSGKDPNEVFELALYNKQQEDELNNAISNPSSVLFSAAKISALSFTDEQALEVSDLYPTYAVGVNYKQGERFTYNGRLFKVNQAHTSQEQWVPGESGTESL